MLRAFGARLVRCLLASASHWMRPTSCLTRFSPPPAWVCDASRDASTDSSHKNKRLAFPEKIKSTTPAPNVTTAAAGGHHQTAPAAGEGGASALHYTPRILAALTSTLSFFE